jgi:hypothetical protein
MCSAVLTLVGASAFAATVYKWVDEKGVTHYSDQPHQNAESVDLKSAQSYQSRGVTPTPSTTAGPAQPAASYRLCEIYRPENDEVFLNTDTVTAKLRLQPDLRGGDRVSVGLDGKRLTSQPAQATEFTLQVDRGTHSLMAVIEDSTGKPVCTSASVTFHVRQPSKQAPNAVNRPRF